MYGNPLAAVATDPNHLRLIDLYGPKFKENDMSNRTHKKASKNRCMTCGNRGGVKEYRQLKNGRWIGSRLMCFKCDIREDGECITLSPGKIYSELESTEKEVDAFLSGIYGDV